MEDDDDRIEKVSRYMAINRNPGRGVVVGRKTISLEMIRSRTIGIES